MSLELVPEPFLAAIGGIITYFNVIDHLLTAILVTLTGNDFLELHAHAPFARMNFHNKKLIIDLLMDLRRGDPSDSPVAKYPSDLRKSLEDIALDRNRIAHSVWMCSDGIVRRQSFKVGKDIKVENCEVQLSDLKVILGKILECHVKTAHLALYLKTVGTTGAQMP